MIFSSTTNRGFFKNIFPRTLTPKLKVFKNILQETKILLDLRDHKSEFFRNIFSRSERSKFVYSPQNNWKFKKKSKIKDFSLNSVSGTKGTKHWKLSDIIFKYLESKTMHF